MGLSLGLAGCGQGRVEITPQLSATELKVGDTLEVDYRLETNTGKATRIRFDLAYPKDVLDPRLPAGDELGDCTLIREGKIVRLERSEDGPLEAGKTLCSVTFEVVGDGEGSLAAVGFGFGSDDEPAGSVGGAGPEKVEFTVTATGG